MIRSRLLSCLLLLLFLVISLVSISTVEACGGLFCQNVPVDQNAERIIFTQNKDGTVTALIEIQFTGFAPDFSWILPIPNPIGQDDLAVPDTAQDAFNELQQITNPVFIPPERPRCAELDDSFFGADTAMSEAEGGVEVFASGEVGPYGFDVIGSDDPNALIDWLRQHNYRVTEPMIPLINVYVQEGFVFLAMRLLPEEDAGSIAPIQITYDTDRPMIPLRLTAVAANPNMGVYVWFYADRQAVPVNYAHMEVADEELTFFTNGGNNYLQLVGQRADEFGGQAFITEFAGPAHEVRVANPLLIDLAQRYAYMTRMYTQISPEEMTVDPVFDYDPQRRDVSNVHDLRGKTGMWDCERSGEGQSIINLPFLNSDQGSTPAGAGGAQAESGSSAKTLFIGFYLGGATIGLLGLLLLGGFLLARRSRRTEE